ncbi:metal-sulfur cluster biosynthetic enzyme [Boudabousia liubingyangii]|uniref:Metal-sulfur cluster biosynthetic enzyme n=2 Tax=Boudabousia liubingyangii TaxID=1921764 RepID=A0A1Q5PNV6_9ACTO|nr:metal-sulfur cluster biosynthetic enzyme [Boudabousia liubingyangii]OKL49189.1 metal-sulfur cluster biosynthetic enzyme [Boudabousia liubingyangii]
MADASEVPQRFAPAPAPGEGPELSSHGTLAAEDVAEAMRDVIDPELGINVVDLGLVYGITVEEDNHVAIDMTLTSAACPLTDVLEQQTQMVLEPIANGATITWVWMPPWGPDRITEDGRAQLRALGFNV